MILDKVLHGVLDQGRGCLLVFDEPEADVSADSSSLVTTTSWKKEYVWRCDSNSGAGGQGGRIVICQGKTPGSILIL